MPIWTEIRIAPRWLWNLDDTPVGHFLYLNVRFSLSTTRLSRLIRSDADRGQVRRLDHFRRLQGDEQSYKARTTAGVRQRRRGCQRLMRLARPSNALSLVLPARLSALRARFVAVFIRLIRAEHRRP